MEPNIHNFEEYQSLLQDLDQWVDSTHGKLKKELPKFTSVSAVLKEMDSSKVRLENFDIFNLCF